MSSSQEETDTRIMIYCLYAKANEYKNIALLIIKLKTITLKSVF